MFRSVTSRARLYGWLLACALAIPHAAVAEEPPTLTIDAGGHTAVITSLMTLADGTLLTSSFDNTIRHWDLKTGQTIRVIRGQVGNGRRGQVNALAITPDGRTLLAGGWFDNDERGRHPIRVYDWPQGTLRGLLEGHDRPVRSIAISPDGQFLASGDFGGMLRFWKRTATGFALLSSVQAHTERCGSLTFDPTGGNLLISAGYDGIARFWSFGPQGIRETLAIRPLSLPFIYAVSFRRDGQVIAFGGASNVLTDKADGEVKFFDRRGQALGAPITFDQTGVTAVSFSPDSTRLAIGLGFPGTDTRAIVYSHPDHKVLCEFQGHDNTINGMCFLPGGRTIASVGSYDNAILRWDAATAKPLPQLGGRSRFYWNAGVSRDGKTLYWGSSLYDPKGLFNLEKANERGPLDFGLRLSDKGPEVVPAAGNNIIRGSSVLGNLRLERYQDQKWQFVQLEPGGAKMESKRDRDVIFGATFLPHTDGSKFGAKTPVLVAGGESLGLFDASTGRRVHELLGHVGQILAVAPSPIGDFAISTGGDQTLRLWHLPTGELRMSIFSAGDDWVAWTPKGFYAASPQGDRLIGWQINRGEGKDPEHYTAAQFANLLYRPDLIRNILNPTAGPDPGPGVDKIGEIVPPDVQVVEPAITGTGPTKLTAGKVQVRALASSKGKFPITEVRLMLDGRPFEGKLGLQKLAKPRRGSVTAEWTIDLQPGTHQLAVQAKTSVSTAVSQAVPVSFVTATRVPNLVVLAIGVSEYPGALRLNYAAKDAQAIEQVLRTRGGGVREVKTKVVIDQEATRKNIMGGLNWLKKEMNQGDAGVIFYSGHSMKDDSDSFYLCPVDVDPNDLFSTGVPGTLFKEFLAGVPGKVIAILDGCHTGELGKEGVKKKGTTVVTDDVVRGLINEEVGVVVLSSSRGDEVSLESNEHRQGYFTLALTQGLSGAADQDNDGIVELRELDPYVKNEVKRLTSDRQHPVTSMPANFLPPPLTILSTKTVGLGSGTRVASLAP